MSWQSIETAPKDGSEFLVVYGRQGNVMKLVRMNRMHGFFTSKGVPELGLMNNATHWMPLPTPPND